MRFFLKREKIENKVVTATHCRMENKVHRGMRDDSGYCSAQLISYTASARNAKRTLLETWLLGNGNALCVQRSACRNRQTGIEQIHQHIQLLLSRFAPPRRQFPSYKHRGYPVEGVSLGRSTPEAARCLCSTQSIMTTVTKRSRDPSRQLTSRVAAETVRMCGANVRG